LLAAGIAPAEPLSAPAAREVRLVMGTTAEVQVQGLADPTRALDEAFAALARVDDEMSLWKPSALSALNDRGAGPVPPDLLTVIAHALDVAEASGGAFDPTVEPLVRAAGGLGGPRRRLGAGERTRLLSRVGYRRVHVDLGSRVVRLEAGARLDLGGIAKGFAADRALASLRAAGATAGLVDLGGSSIGVFGTPLTAEARDPLRRGARPWATFAVEDAAVATSGGDERPGHIVDPRTGRPASQVLAATVVARSGIEADALSTAVFVLGPEEGLRLLRRRGAGGLVLLRDRRGRPVVRTTPGFSGERAFATAPGVRAEE
jgi:thiamine biosynthesis lipoprotein